MVYPPGAEGAEMSLDRKTGVSKDHPHGLRRYFGVLRPPGIVLGDFFQSFTGGRSLIVRLLWRVHWVQAQGKGVGQMVNYLYVCLYILFVDASWFHDDVLIISSA